MNPNGASIRALRKAKHVGLRGLATTIGRHRSYLSRLERGERGASDDTLILIAAALGESVDAITRDSA
jgi:transcriptional regulator with XRE-family HTH domain